MSESAKNNILNKIRMALATPTPLPFPQIDTHQTVVQPLQDDMVVTFAENFTQLQGKFAFCVNEQELIAHFNTLCQQHQWTKIYNTEPKLQALLPQPVWYNDIKDCEASVTSCEYLVARTGSMVISSVKNGRIPSVYAPVHICIAYTSQLVYDIKDALQNMQLEYGQQLPSVISLATGPSRTADIEKTLVTGVHGPKEVYVFLVDQ